MKHLGVLTVLLGFFSVLAADDNNQAWTAWTRESHRQCPGNHLEWICDGCYDGVLDEFVKTLPASTQRRIANIADYSHRCSAEVGGFSCEMAVHLDAFGKLGLLRGFTTFTCKHYACSAPALCTPRPSSTRDK